MSDLGTPPTGTETTTGAAILSALVRLEVHVEGALSRIGDHETRVRILERDRWIMIGASLVIGGLSGKVGSIFL